MSFELLRSCIAPLFLLLLTVPPQSPPASSLRFEQLKSVVGDWVAPSPSGTGSIRESYALISNGTVLVQRYLTSSGKETLTVFHVDGAAMLATHYCAQGNQPRLKLEPTGTPESFAFSFLDATNLTDRASAHLVRLELRLTGRDQLTEIETYEEAGKKEVTTLQFRRTTH
jgi:hypothetical protein